MEVKPETLYRVEITEYEAGWGQRQDPADTKYFTTLEEAEAYKGPSIIIAFLFKLQSTADCFIILVTFPIRTALLNPIL